MFSSLVSFSSVVKTLTDRTDASARFGDLPSSRNFGAGQTTISNLVQLPFRNGHLPMDLCAYGALNG